MHTDFLISHTLYDVTDYTSGWQLGPNEVPKTVENATSDAFAALYFENRVS